MRRSTILLAVTAAASFVFFPILAEAARPVVCLLPFTDARLAKSPQSVPFKIRTENTPEPMRAHPSEGPNAVRRMALGALQREMAVEVLDLAGADPKALAVDPRIQSCQVLVGGAVFNYEGTVTVDIYGNKIFSGLVGYELVAVDVLQSRRLFAPVVFAGRRQSDVVRPDDDYGSSDRQVFNQWIAEALKVASASLPQRFARPTAQAAVEGPPEPR